MGLIIGRCNDQAFMLFADPEADQTQLLEELKHGIKIRMHRAEAGKAYVDICAPKGISIVRSELLKRDQDNFTS